MTRSTRIVLLAAALVFGGSAASRAEESAPYATRHGDWKASFDQGFTQDFVENGSKNIFSLNCDVGRTENGKETYIAIRIHGKDPAPNSSIAVVLDGEEISFSADDAGLVKTDCDGCSAKFEHLWKKLIKSKTMLVRLADGHSSGFSLKGARQALDPEVCGAK
jgi:hypothetical protein